VTPAQKVLHDCPWCRAGDEPVPGSPHAAAWEVVRAEALEAAAAELEREVVDQALARIREE
jgi:hypothetical protein